MGWTWMQVNAVIFSILMPKNVFYFKKLEQTTFSSHQIAKYVKFAIAAIPATANKWPKIIGHSKA